MYNQQIRKLNQNIYDKKDLIESEEKLQQPDYVDYVEVKYKTLFHGEQCGMEISSAHHADLFLMLDSLQLLNGV